MYDRAGTATDTLAIDDDDVPTAEVEGGINRVSTGDEDMAEAIVSTTLAASAEEAWDAFCDVEATPRWVSVVKSVRVLDRDEKDRPRRVAFLARLERATIGYTLEYAYDEETRTVTWASPEGRVAVSGRARFIPLGPRACMLEYQLELELPGGALPPWEDPFFSGHAASVVMNDFRDYLTRSRGH
jgi:uncharacterized membrane protein